MELERLRANVRHIEANISSKEQQFAAAARRGDLQRTATLETQIQGARGQLAGVRSAIARLERTGLG